MCLDHVLIERRLLGAAISIPELRPGWWVFTTLSEDEKGREPEIVHTLPIGLSCRGCLGTCAHTYKRGVQAHLQQDTKHPRLGPSLQELQI